MSVSVPRVCPECGSDTYWAQNFERVRDKAYRLEAEVRRMAAAHAVEKAEWRLREIEQENNRSAAQSKAHRQRLVINRLEKKLRKLGQQPHADAPGTSE